MSRKSKVTAASAETLNVRPALVRTGLVLAILTAMTAFAVRAGAQTITTNNGAVDLRPTVTAPTLLPQGLPRAPAALAATVAAPSHGGVVFAPAPFFAPQRPRPAFTGAASISAAHSSRVSERGSPVTW